MLALTTSHWINQPGYHDRVTHPLAHSVTISHFDHTTNISGTQNQTHKAISVTKKLIS